MPTDFQFLSEHTSWITVKTVAAFNLFIPNWTSRIYLRLASLTTQTVYKLSFHLQILSQCFTTFSDLRHPTEGNIISGTQWALSRDPNAICFKVWWHFENSVFDDILKNALARGTPEYRKWHLGCCGIPVGNHCSKCFMGRPAISEMKFNHCRSEKVCSFNMSWHSFSINTNTPGKYHVTFKKKAPTSATLGLSYCSRVSLLHQVTSSLIILNFSLSLPTLFSVEKISRRFSQRYLLDTSTFDITSVAETQSLHSTLAYHKTCLL